MADGVAAVGEYPISELVQQVLAAGHHDDGRAAAGELVSGRLADARRRAGEQDALAVEVDILLAGSVQHQLWRDRRSHAGQHQLVGQPPQRALTHPWSL